MTKTDPRASCRGEELTGTSCTLSIPSFRANGIAEGARRRRATPTVRPAHPGSSFAWASRAPHSPRFARPACAFAMPRRALQRPHGELAGASYGAAAAARPPHHARPPAPTPSSVHRGPVDHSSAAVHSSARRPATRETPRGQPARPPAPLLALLQKGPRPS